MHGWSSPLLEYRLTPSDKKSFSSGRLKLSPYQYQVSLTFRSPPPCACTCSIIVWFDVQNSVTCRL